MRRRLLFTTVAVLALILVSQMSAQPTVHTFQGYWMGIDPVDGGDARRSFLAQSDGTFRMIGRDTVLTLCDSTDRGVATFDDGVVSKRTHLASDTLTIQCFNTEASVVLKARYELINPSTMVEVATLQDGTPVSTIVLHRTSGQ